MYMYLSSTNLFSFVKKFSWRFSCNDDDDDDDDRGMGVETTCWTTCQYVGGALEVVQHIYVCVCLYMYLTCTVCVTMGKRTLPSCSRASPCRQERGREIMRDGVIYG